MILQTDRLRQTRQKHDHAAFTGGKQHGTLGQLIKKDNTSLNSRVNTGVDTGVNTGVNLFYQVTQSQL